MRRTYQRFAASTGTPPGRPIAVAALLLVAIVLAADASGQTRSDRRLQDKADEARRREGEALVNLADAAMTGHAVSDFAIRWDNDFFKAQGGTFVPFTLTIDRSGLTAPSALLYVRAA